MVVDNVAPRSLRGLEGTRAIGPCDVKAAIQARGNAWFSVDRARLRRGVRPVVSCRGDLAMKDQHEPWERRPASSSTIAHNQDFALARGVFESSSASTRPTRAVVGEPCHSRNSRRDAIFGDAAWPGRLHPLGVLAGGLRRIVLNRRVVWSGRQGPAIDAESTHCQPIIRALRTRIRWRVTCSI